jgi:hypothetical protein
MSMSAKTIARVKVRAFAMVSSLLERFLVAMTGRSETSLANRTGECLPT